jgi:electron transfer flavoprotein beta subunit
MKIFVLAKQVPDPEKFPIGSFKADYRLSRDSFPKTVNPVDKNALELALTFTSSDNVEVLTVGPESAKDAIRDLLSIGAGSASMVCDGSLTGADLLSTASALSGLVKYRGDFDLILCAKQSTDAGNASLPAMVAEMMGIPCVCGAEKVELDGDDVIAHVPSDDGIKVWRVKLPALISVTKNINTPRLPSLRGMTKAMQVNINTYNLAQLGVLLPDIRMTSANIIQVHHLSKEIKTVIIEGETPQVSTKALLDALKERGVLA